MKFRRQSEEAPGRRRDPLPENSEPRVSLQNRYTFRRNRTLTGSSSASIASGAELNAELRSPRAHAHHLSLKRRKLGVYFIGVIGIALLLFLLVNQLMARLVIQIDAQPSVLSVQNEYQEAFDSYFAARPIERLYFLTNETELLAHVRVSHPEVERIELNSANKPGEYFITLKPRVAIARWSIDGANRYVDQHGVVFSRNFGTVPRLQIIDNSGIPTSSSGGAVASNRFLGFIGRLIGAAERENLNISKITIPTLTTRQVAVSLKGESTIYRFSVDRSVGKQAEDMARIHRYLASKNINPAYVDVRVEGKAVYK